VTESALRKVSLALAAMHPGDRRWMLARLPRTASEAWTRHADEAHALVRRDPTAALRRLMGSAQPVDVEVPEPLTLIRALDRLPVAWVARSLALVAPDHVDVYKAVCRADRLSALQREPSAPVGRAPPALAHALAAILQRLGSAPDVMPRADA
jgi:hypothetical protein